MLLQQFTKLGLQHIKHNLTEAVYLKTGLDFTKPRSIQGIVNERCNYKCRYCNFWRLDNYQSEMTIAQWQKALLSLKEFLGWYVIQFAGGEPFIKKGFVDLLEFCHAEGIAWGVITNGSTFNRKIVERVVAARPVNIDISVDSAIAEIHDFVRGMPNSHSNISQGIIFLREEQKRQGINFPIRIKPTVHRYNLRHLLELVNWTKQIGATTIDFSAVKHWTTEVKTELWIQDEHDLEILRQTVETLVAMKKDGAPIETSEQKLYSFIDHFQGKTVKYGVLPCRLSLRDYHIRPNGDIIMCHLYPPLGNVRTSSAREIWYSKWTKQLRAQMVQCEKLGQPECGNLCLASHVPLLQQFQRGLLLLRQVGFKEHT
ncbi:radical SAM protein [Chlorogloeopsis sp. ULAP02]|uniref:radical SAM protein n=1 Tax=Chlorogloeopsis sp. ULAP02 TaxID=3107926 RepID=UPI0031364F3F